MPVPGKITAFPNGASSFGVPILPAPGPWAGDGVYWVCNRTSPTISPVGDGSSPKYPLSSVFGAGGALSKVNGQQGSTIIILPGHVETIGSAVTFSSLANPSSLTNGGADINIIGLGSADDRPTFNFTAAASQVKLDLAGTWWRNCVLNLAATASTTVTAPVQVRAANCGFDTVVFNTAVSATQLCTTAVDIGTGANKCSVINCTFAAGTAGTYATNPTDILKVTAAVDQLYIGNCDLQCATNATGNGVLNIAAAATNMIVEDTAFINYKASSTVAVIGTAGMTGEIRYCDCQIQAATGAASSISTPGNASLIQCYGATPGKAGILIGTAST